jgi:glycosyltransferase involved in cell wall biosynthesis
MKHKALLLHNKYKIAGGEDSVVTNESLLLKHHNALVDVCYLDNQTITGFVKKVLTLLQTPFVLTNNKRIKALTANKALPDVAHVHNYFPLLSPSIFRAIKNQNIVTVHTLHNYRSVCPTALLMFNSKVEERSITHSSWWAVTKKVYRNSSIGTFALCCMIELHKKLGTWHKHVDAFIALTEFSRNKFIEAGWPANKIYVKPNFIEDKFEGALNINKEGGYAVYVGRLSEEKDIFTLLNAWENISYPLKIIGVGPLENFVKSNTNEHIEYLGKLESDDVLNCVQNADILVLPSICYEGFPMVLVEAMCSGTPSVVSKLGSMEEIIDNGKTGLHFTPGNSDDLANKINGLLADKTLLKVMASNSRQEYLDKYTPEINYEQLMGIYEHAIKNSKDA